MIGRFTGRPPLPPEPFMVAFLLGLALGAISGALLGFVGSLIFGAGQ